MRDINRLEDFYKRMKEQHKTVYDWRFGQLLCNTLGAIQEKLGGRDLFFVEDEEFIKAFEEVMKEMRGE